MIREGTNGLVGMPSPVATSPTAQSYRKGYGNRSDSRMREFPRVQRLFVKLMDLTSQGDDEDLSHDESFASQPSELDRKGQWTSSSPSLRNDVARKGVRPRAPLRPTLRSASLSASPVHESESRVRFSSPARTADRASPPVAHAGMLTWPSESRERRVSFCATITVMIIPAIDRPVRADA